MSISKVRSSAIQYLFAQYLKNGLLKVRIDGVSIEFVNRQYFIELGNIKKCNTYGGNVFLLEEFGELPVHLHLFVTVDIRNEFFLSDRKENKLIQRRYISAMVSFHSECISSTLSNCKLYKLEHVRVCNDNAKRVSPEL